MDGDGDSEGGGEMRLIPMHTATRRSHSAKTRRKKNTAQMACVKRQEFRFRARNNRHCANAANKVGAFG
ncbi:MAG: hypothetical protein DBX55_03930 [Verrucomicrobia bacterium]|nr:MAG: hypothetical protein DBX55_03930 [Verrucomicrobiota bacterium]